MDGGLLGAGAAWEWSEGEQGGGGGGAAEVAVVDGRAVVGAVRAAVVGVQIVDQARAERSDGERPGFGDAVAVAGVDEHVGDRDAGGVHALQDGYERGGWVVIAGAQVHAAGELGDGWAVFVVDGRGGLEVVAVEQLVFLAGSVAAAVTPGCLGVGAAGRGWWLVGGALGGLAGVVIGSGVAERVGGGRGGAGGGGFLGWWQRPGCLVGPVDCVAAAGRFAEHLDRGFEQPVQHVVKPL